MQCAMQGRVGHSLTRNCIKPELLLYPISTSDNMFKGEDYAEEGVWSTLVTITSMYHITSLIREPSHGFFFLKKKNYLVGFQP